MANAVLKKILSIISDLDSNAEAVAAEVEDLKNFPGYNRGRFYYESILERHPENSSLANFYYDDVMDTAIKFLKSSEFLDKHISVFRDLAPDKSALIFCHIPKTGGTTVSYSIEQSNKFSVLKLPELLGEGWGLDLIDYYAEKYRDLQRHDTKFYFKGHLSTRDIIRRNIKKPGDRIFSLIRDPFQIMISWINFTMTLSYLKHIDDAEHADNPDVIQAYTLLGAEFIEDKASISSQLIEKIVHNFIRPNPICSYLGVDPSFKSAVETCEILDIELYHTSKVDYVLRSYGINDTVTRNISKKFIDRHTLSRDVYELIFEMIEEDLKFYNYFISRAG